MKKKTAIIVIPVIIILIATICSCRKNTVSDDKAVLEKYLLSKEYKYLVLESAHSDEKTVYAGFTTKQEGKRTKEDEVGFANEIKLLKTDMESYLQHNYNDSLPYVPDVKIAVLNDDAYPVTIYMTNHSTIYSDAPVY